MFNFPIPCPEELIYSTVARAGIHTGMVSPKQLLDEVFKDRGVVATFDMPNHLSSIAEQYSAALGLTVERLVYDHTLFPIYAPFTTEARRQRCLEWFASTVRESIHMILGVVASRVRQGKFARYCPACLELMQSEYGEFYWDRRWQVEGADCCLKHGALVQSELKRHSYHRHQFLAASPALCPSISRSQAWPRQAVTVAKQVCELLSIDPLPSASYVQWSVYYAALALRGGCNRGRHIDYDSIKTRVISTWSLQWLEKHGLGVDDSQSCWLRTIFRKHRKSFSYLEHIVVLESFLPVGWRIGDVLADVRRTDVPMRREECKEAMLVPAMQLNNKRDAWFALLQGNGVNHARRNGGGALYAWLYRHDKAWLMSVNSKYTMPSNGVNTRVDWHARDVAVVRKLIRIRNRYQKLVDGPRRSRNWYLSNFSNSASLEKNIARLPVTNLFFEKYCEPIAEYQVRRIERSKLACDKGALPLRRWKLLKLSGLSEERLTNEARSVLDLYFQ